MKSVQLKVIDNSCPYNQNSQTSDIQFALLKRLGPDSFEELHYHVKCREYLGDTLLAAYADKDTSLIYGFSLSDGKRMALDETIFSISLPTRFDPDKISYESFIKGISIIRKLEKTMGVPLKSRSTYYLTDKKVDNKDKLVVVSPKEWSYSPLLISLYTFVLRLTTYKVSDKAVSLRRYMKEVSSIYSGTDINYIEYLSGLDINFLLSNYVEILGDAPLTGLDDSKILEVAFASIHAYDDNVSIEYDCSNYGKSTNEEAFWSLYKNHNLHGVVSFANCIQKDETRRNHYLKASEINYKWAKNYMRLLESTSNG